VARVGEEVGYGDKVHSVECGSFTPLVFSTFGGLGREATVFYSRLADLLSNKHGTSYAKTLSLCVVTAFHYPGHQG